MRTKMQIKKRIRRMIVCVLSLALLMGCLAGCGSTSTVSRKTPTDSNTLRVGVRANVSRLGYLEDTGRYSGLEVDIATEMAERLGYEEVEFLTTTPNTKEEMLYNDDVDCIVACFSITPEREETFDFSPAYYEDSSVIMVQNSSLISVIAGLKGYTIGTRSGSNATADLNSKLTEVGFTDGEVVSVSEDGTEIEYSDYKVKQLETYQDLSDALDLGTIDAICADKSIIYTYLDSSRKFLDLEIAPQNYGVATLKGSALSEPISETIQDMLDDGSIASYIDKWFEEEQ